jgi:hypothetical protein
LHLTSRTCLVEDCDKPTTGNSKYCSDSHRTRYNRQQKAAAKRAAENRKPPTLPENQLQRGTAEAIKEAVAPTIEEALTAEVKQSLRRAVQLTPKAIDAIEKDLESENEFLRQHAYQTLLKYTIGSNQLVPDLAADHQPLTVIVEGLDRPEAEEIRTPMQNPSTAAELEADLQGNAETPQNYRICDSCQRPKPVDQFIGNSNRCLTCFDRMRESAAAVVGS